MDPPADIEAFWLEFLSQTGRARGTPLYDVCHFADNEEDADALLALVLSGRKRATASLVWQLEASGKRLPQVGDLTVVTDWRGAPRCVMETSAVEVRSFAEVDAEFAAAEGEGDLSLEHWRRAHWAYFRRLCERLGRERSSTMPVLCERFRLVFAETGR